MIDGDLRSAAQDLAAKFVQHHPHMFEMTPVPDTTCARAHESWYVLNDAMYRMMDQIHGLAHDPPTHEQREEAVTVRARYVEQMILNALPSSDGQAYGLVAAMLSRHELEQRVWQACAEYIRSAVLTGIEAPTDGMVRSVVSALTIMLINAQYAGMAHFGRHKNATFKDGSWIHRHEDARDLIHIEKPLFGSGDLDPDVALRRSCNTIRLIHPALDEDHRDEIEDILRGLLHMALTFEHAWFSHTIKLSDDLVKRLEIGGEEGWLFQLVRVSLAPGRYATQLTRSGQREIMVWLEGESFSFESNKNTVLPVDAKAIISEAIEQHNATYSEVYDDADELANIWKFCINLFAHNDSYTVGHGMFMLTHLSSGWFAENVFGNKQETAVREDVFYYDVME